MNIAGTPMGKVSFSTPNIFQFVAIKNTEGKKKLFLLTFDNVTILTILISLKVFSLFFTLQQKSVHDEEEKFFVAKNFENNFISLNGQKHCNYSSKTLFFHIQKKET